MALQTLLIDQNSVVAYLQQIKAVIVSFQVSSSCVQFLVPAMIQILAELAKGCHSHVLSWERKEKTMPLKNFRRRFIEAKYYTGLPRFFHVTCSLDCT